MTENADQERAAVLAANAAFYDAFAAGDFDAMCDIWADSEDIVCIHPGWPPVRGRIDVLASWRGIMDNPPEPAVRPSAAEAYMMGDAAMVICTESIGEIVLTATNVFRKVKGAWVLVHHHAGLTEHRPGTAQPVPSGTLH